MPSYSWRCLLIKRNWVIVVIISLCIFALVVACWLSRMNSAEKYLLHNNDEAVEVLLQEEIDSDRIALFYLDGAGNIFCAILKEHILGYEILRISGKCSVSKPGPLCSYYYDEDEQLWIAWGLVTNNNVSAVVADGKEMSIKQAGAYTYRICWLTGNGKTPECFEEIP